MRPPRLLGFAAVVLALVTGWGGGGARAETAPSLDPLAPARFTVEIVEQEGGGFEWTQADGYREAVTSTTATVEASDPRIGGTLTMTVAGREFGADGDPAEVFGVTVGTARIDGAEGAWVGRVEGFSTEEDSSLRILLAGEGAYDGLTGLIRGSGADTAEGVIFGYGLPPAPAEPAPATVAPVPEVRLDLANDRAVIPLGVIPADADHVGTFRRVVPPGAEGALARDPPQDWVSLEYAYEGSIRVTNEGLTRVWRSDGTIEDLAPGTPHVLGAGDVELTSDGDAVMTYQNEGATEFRSLMIQIGAKRGAELPEVRPPERTGVSLDSELPGAWLQAPLAFGFERLTLDPGAWRIDLPVRGLGSWWWVESGGIQIEQGEWRRCDPGMCPPSVWLTNLAGDPLAAALPGRGITALMNERTEPATVIHAWAGSLDVAGDWVRSATPPAAHFTMQFDQDAIDEPEWTEVDGYRQGVLTQVGTVKASDPRISGTLTMTITGRLFGADEGSPGVYVGSVRIDNPVGAWVGTIDGVAGGFEDVQLLLAGEGAYEGLTALIRDSADQSGFEGVLFSHGLPPMPDPVEPPKLSQEPSPPGQVSPTPAIDGWLPRPSAAPTPPPPRPPVDIPDGPAPPQALRVGRSLGDPQAPVKIDVYQDPQCPHCAIFVEDIEPQLIAGPVTDGEVFLTYRDFAVIGQESQDAAVALRVAEALGGRFWDYQRVLYDNQGAMNSGAFTIERLADFAEAVGIDREAFLEEMRDPGYLEAVEAEGAEARALSIDAVPTLVINGVVTEGVPSWESLASAIEAARSSQSPRTSLPPNYDGQDLQGVRYLAGEDLSGASFKRARLDDADLSDADLSGADLTEASLVSAMLFRATLVGADLTGADLEWASLDDADLSGARLVDAKLTGLDSAELRGADLTGADLSDIDLLDAKLAGAILRQADLAEQNLWKRDLSAADLSGADLSGATLTGADLTDARLVDADLSGADLGDATLTGADLTRARLDGSDLVGAIGLTDEMLSAALDVPLADLPAALRAAGLQLENYYTIERAVARLCEDGTPLDGVRPYVAGPGFHPMVVNGGYVRTEWEPVAARHTELVACVRERKVREVSCGFYQSDGSPHLAGYVSRIWFRWVVRVVVASDGTVLAERTFRPGDPKRCPRTIDLAPGEPGPRDLYGRPSTKAVLRFLRPFVGDNWGAG